MDKTSGAERDEFGVVLEQLRKVQAAMRVLIRGIQDVKNTAWEWRDRRDELRSETPVVHDEMANQRTKRDELNVDIAQCGLSGSPTKVHRVESVVLGESDHLKIKATKDGMRILVQKLKEDRIFG